MGISTPPTWMLKVPNVDVEPRWEPRSFHGIQMNGWYGYVRIGDIAYFSRNRRTTLQIQKLEQENRREEPTNDQIIDRLIDDPGLAIKPLAENIVLNGLRQPLVLSYQRDLLDGNRRYLAHQWILRSGSHAEVDRFSVVGVWVLSPQFSDEEHTRRVVTEFNFLSDFRAEWKDFVKAQLLYEEHNEHGLTYDQLYEMYSGAGFSKNKIQEFIKTYEVIIEFVERSQDQDAALQLAYDNFIWFQQLQRSYRDEIRNDDEFQQVIFDNIRRGDIQTTDHLKNLKKMKNHRQAWKAFREGDVDWAHHLLKEYELSEKERTAPDQLMDKVITNLEQLASTDGFVDRISTENRDRFHELAAYIPGQVSDVNRRVDNILIRLSMITSEELALLSEQHIQELEEALRRVVQQARSTGA